MEQKTSFIEIVLTVVVIYLVIDFIGCMAWGLSGQFPADSFYIGSISRNILQALLF